MWRELAAETGFCTKWCTSGGQTPRPPSSTRHFKFRLRRHRDSFTIPFSIRYRRVWSSNLSIQLRRTQTSNTESLRCLSLWQTPDNRTIRSNSHQRRLHTKQCTTGHETFSKTISVNGEHSRTWWVRYLVSWENLILGHCCQRMFCP